jgi:hypothetical protein
MIRDGNFGVSDHEKSSLDLVGQHSMQDRSRKSESGAG